MARTLYVSGREQITDDDFASALRACGVREGDTIFVHSDIRTFGRVVLQRRRLFLRTFVDVLEKSVGCAGTIVMPTFTYSFCKGEVYNVTTTRSTVGALTEFFRTEQGVERSAHPIFSVAAWGANAKDFTQTSKDSFGLGTSFDTLRRLGGKLVLLGTDFQTCTFLHHIEQMAGVPYRFMKTFTGIIAEGKTNREDAYTYFVRPLDGTIENDFTVIEPLLRDKRLVHETRVGNGRILVVGAEQLYTQGMQLLQHDPYFFVTQAASA